MSTALLMSSLREVCRSDVKWFFRSCMTARRSTLGYRLDMLIEESVVVEVKAVDQLTRLHEAQLITYLKLSRLRLGFLMNFNTRLFTEGLRRRVV